MNTSVCSSLCGHTFQFTEVNTEEHDRWLLRSECVQFCKNHPPVVQGGRAICDLASSDRACPTSSPARGVVGVRVAAVPMGCSGVSPRVWFAFPR